MQALPDQQVCSWVKAQPEQRLYVSAITLGELRRGASLLEAGKRRRNLEVWLESELMAGLLRRILPVTPEVADRWGRLDADCKLRGTPLGMADGIIAATALEHRLVVATRNVRHFEATGAPLLNPWDFSLEKPV